jgi:hypothetical protein
VYINPSSVGGGGGGGGDSGGGGPFLKFCKNSTSSTLKCSYTTYI